jgi:hypothetical protein
MPMHRVTVCIDSQPINRHLQLELIHLKNGPGGLHHGSSGGARSVYGALNIHVTMSPSKESKF